MTTAKDMTRVTERRGPAAQALIDKAYQLEAERDAAVEMLKNLSGVYDDDHDGPSPVRCPKNSCYLCDARAFLATVEAK